MIDRLRAQEGFTLVEVLLASTLMIIVLAATLTVFDQFVSTSNRNSAQNDAQDTARTMVDQVTRQLRNLALPTPQSPNSIDHASGNDLVFKTADPGRRRVRYCLDTSNSPYSTSNGALWLEVQKVTTVGDTDPAMPDISTCPATTGWASKQIVATHVTNMNNASRSIFSYNGPAATPSKITEIHVSLYVDVDPNRAPAETRISSGVFLRNQNQAPAANIAQPASYGGGRFVFNGASSSDPEGRTLAYFWFLGASPSYTNAISSGACNASDGCIGTGVLEDYTIASTQTFTLLVKDPGGLTATQSTTCTPSTGLCTTPQ